ncbi:hypothetical protein [Paenibacillus ihuae]|uniref:hypothetical protein n=1 Tax=Paenibacillus ihuae TaxID=1232431 RepID=UPI0006D5A180|nr:hypothetical protein [Paenibacillus ihuae]
MNAQTLRSLSWYNLKLTAQYSWLLSALLLSAVPFFMDPEMMEWGQAARLGELLVSFLGLLVYPHLAMLEEGGIGEVLYAKRLRPHPIFLYRWLLTTLFVCLLIAIFFSSLQLRGAVFDLWPMIGGVTITAVAIGSTGMTATLLFRNTSGGYIAGFAWYLLDFTTKGRLTGHFYLFGLVNGSWNSDKLLLAGLSCVLAVFCAFLLPVRKLD